MLVCAGLGACATSDKPAYSFNEILIVNNSRELIRDVSISAPDSGRSFSCANIAPRGICSNKFPTRPYRYQPIRIDWVFANQARQTERFIIDVPPTLYTGLVLRGVLEISPDGAISAYFQQENPIR
jgi:hypothetical protein